jgi:hypothetical protein
MNIIKRKRGNYQVYRIKQDLFRLKGYYLSAAVVAAQTPEKAVTALRRHFEELDPDDCPIIDNERLTVEEIATGASERFVLAETGVDND